VTDVTNPIQRRRILTSMCALGLGVSRVARSQASTSEAAALPPQDDDLLAYAFGQKEGQIITPADLTIGATQVFAFAMDPATRAMRNASRLNQMVLVRLEPAWLSEATRARSAGGIVAYSGVCTHTGCDITDWNAEQNRFQCPCHESQFDPSDGARVVGGPAPWQLAAVPLKLVDGQVKVAGGFIGRVGFQQPGLDPLSF
jgi:Rieske Fe-S protein